MSRRNNGVGLSFRKVRIIPNFICEACTVRMVLCRELHTTTDITLLMLERVSILDRLWSVNPGTFSGYQSNLKRITQFEMDFDLHQKILQPAQPVYPPHGPTIPLMWCQELYSLRPSSKRRDKLSQITVTFEAIRKMRTAVSHYAMWDAMVTQLKPCYFNNNKQMIQQECRFTGMLPFQMHALGMSTQIGTQMFPSLPLLPCHVAALDQDLDLRY